MKWATVVLFQILLTSMPAGLAQTVRPVADSVGFCWNADEMTTLTGYLEQHAEPVEVPKGTPVAAISVHDDYLYAGRVYSPLYSMIRAREVVIFGVTHGSVRRAMGSLSNVIILDEFDAWRGPYGPVGISPLRQIIRSRLPGDDVMVSNSAHATEHSIEALIPFLQHYNRDVIITPIMVTQMPFERMQHLSDRLAAIIAEYVRARNLEPGKDIFFLISNDANHYGPDFDNVPYGTNAQAHRLATDNDRRIIQSWLVGEVTETRIKGLAGELWPDSMARGLVHRDPGVPAAGTAPGYPIPVWCGRYPIPFGLLTTTKVLGRLGRGPLAGTLLRYSDSFTEKVVPVQNTSMGLTAVFSYQHWCGWFTEVFTVR